MTKPTSKKSSGAKPPSKAPPKKEPAKKEPPKKDPPRTKRSRPIPSDIPEARSSDREIPRGARDAILPGYDLDHEEALDVAPIGPTEVVQDIEVAAVLEREPHSVKEIEQEIRALEHRLDDLIQKRGTLDGAAPARSAPPDAPQIDRAAVDRATADALPVGRAAPSANALPVDRTAPNADVRDDVQATHEYLKERGRTAIRERSEEVDEFGLDRSFEARYRPFLDFLHRYYFRVETDGASRIPDAGRCLLVCNHSSGPFPYDGLMLRTIVRREHPTQRDLRWLSEDFIYYLPFAGTMMTRLGAVRACPENAERLLAKEGAVAVFPEGEKGIGKLFHQRYRLQRFGRGGFIRLSLRTRSPIIPVAIVGAEESNPLLYKFETLAKVFGVPYLPITPTFPALGAAGLLPAPTKWRVGFGDPIAFPEYGPQAADDDILVMRLSEQVRGTIQGMLDRMVAGRRSIWLG